MIASVIIVRIICIYPIQWEILRAAHHGPQTKGVHPMSPLQYKN